MEATMSQDERPEQRRQIQPPNVNLLHAGDLLQEKMESCLRESIAWKQLQGMKLEPMVSSERLP
ncbi:MAG TPA: hypothetical protein VFH87_01720 [Candidatus Udaeobacter sp.]|nr:hypothetical protein [Candidatus Udaeobacter sp.]